MMSIIDWCRRWNVPYQALQELDAVAFSEVANDKQTKPGMSEEAAASRIVSNAPLIQQTLWRNNSGAYEDDNGNHVRYGVANTSAKINKKFKSSDYVGITEVIVYPHHVGQKFGVFTGIETKKTGWTTPTNEREFGQLNFLKKVNMMGGIGMFATSPQQVQEHVKKIRGY